MSYAYTPRCLLRDGAPWLPMMGEMHYTRYDPRRWSDELHKMRAGGVDVVSTYVIWIHHEERRGTFDFTGCRDLRRFVLAARDAGLAVFLRLGPWVHGEVRNGGFPDWVLNDLPAGAPRTDDEAYLACVRAFWSRAAAEVRDLMYDKGGPVIGIQIENEYGHAGGQAGPAGQRHMQTLAALARELGFAAPLYTATGWGGAVTGGLLPVMGGYCDAPWADTAEELPPNANYVFTPCRDDALIASDLGHGAPPTFDAAAFPYLTAELGGGLQVTAKRRPVPTAADIGAMSVVKLGSGASLLGYYMYHGGTNPKGLLSTLQESRAAGSPNDLPECNYDFGAPIGQFGRITDTYRELRLLGLFLRDYGAALAPMPAFVDPPAQDPADLQTLRTARRGEGEQGYVFFNNHQRRHAMAAHAGVRLTAPGRDFPPVDIAPGQYGFFPYGMRLGDAVLDSAAAVPLCRLNTREGEVHVFYGDWAPRFTWQGGARARVLHLPRAEALRAAKITMDQDYLVLANDFVWVEDGRLRVCGGRDTLIQMFPPPPFVPEGFVSCGCEGGFAAFVRRIDLPRATVILRPVRQGTEAAVYDVELTYPPHPPAGYDAWLRLEYAGDGLEIYGNGEKLNDDFYAGRPAELGLGYYGFPTRLRVVVRPLRPQDRSRVHLEAWPAFRRGRACRVDGAQIVERWC